MEETQILKTAIEEQDVKFLCKWFFDLDLTMTQCTIVRDIAFERHKRFSISAMTQYGKSLCVACAVALYIILNKNKQIYFLAPTEQQSKILRDYLAKIIRGCRALLEITELSATKEERLTSQTSKDHQTFANGCSYRVMTCHGEAENLMGHGISEGIVVIDEACLVSTEAYTKIMRMLTSNPDSCMLVELFNPWNRDNLCFDHANSELFHHIHVPWQTAVKEHRTTESHIKEQRGEITPLEFTILYDSKFPMQSEDSIFDLEKIKLCCHDVLKEKKKTIISCDVADKGNDKTVIMQGYQDIEKAYHVIDIYSEDKTESSALSGRIIDLMNKAGRDIIINIDCIGAGIGPLSNVKEAADKKPRHFIKVNGCHFGEKPIIDPGRFANRKAESYFRLKELFDEGLISIPEDKDLIRQLVSMRWDFTSTSKIKIIDPAKSPDLADALVYFTWYSKPPIRAGYVGGISKRSDEEW